MSRNSFHFPHSFLIATHSDRVREGSTFFALKGKNFSLDTIITKAIHNGATTLYIAEECSDMIAETLMKTPGVVVKKSTAIIATLGEVCRTTYGDLSSQFTFIAVTGTKGKSSTVFYLAHFLKSQGFRVAYLSTIHTSILDEVFPATLTTPPLDYTYAFLEECKKKMVTHIIMEVSAQALTQQRITTLRYDAIVFTNFSPEHGEYYQNQEDYFMAKMSLLNYRKKNGCVIVPYEDRKIASFCAENLSSENIRYYGTTPESAFSVLSVKQAFHSCEFFLKTPDHDQPERVICNLFGAYAPQNMCTVFTTLFTIEKELWYRHKKALLQLCQSLPEIRGRVERYEGNNKYFCIDRAHTPHSVALLVASLRPLTHHLTIVFGCGGNRDVEKRPAIGAVVEEYADTIIITEDNPRDELPEEIISDIVKGMTLKKPTHLIIDRKKAIEFAVLHTPDWGIIALVGKGEEEYQERQGKKYYFSERDIVQSIVQSFSLPRIQSDISLQQ